MKKKTTSWGGVSDWYDNLVNLDDSYQQKVILPNILRLVDPKKGQKIIEIGCGQGVFTKTLAIKGADVTGVDISEELISLAKKDKSQAEFVVSSADKDLPFKSGIFDICLFILSLQNIKDFKKALSEARRVLKLGGRLFIVLNHPVFRVPQSSDWGFDKEKNAQFRKIYSYMTSKEVAIVMNPGKGGKEKTYSYHRPLQEYIKALRNSSFVISNLEEWISHKKSEKGPKQVAEDISRKEIPLFMFFEAISQK